MTKAVRNPRVALGSARAAKGDHPAKQVFGLSSRATGGTALAGAELLRRAGGVVERALFVIDLHELGGAEALRAAGVEPWALMAFEGH